MSFFGNKEDVKKSICSFFNFDESISDSEMIEMAEAKLNEMEDLINEAKKLIEEKMEEELHLKNP